MRITTTSAPTGACARPPTRSSPRRAGPRRGSRTTAGTCANLQAISVPGHMPAELAYFERSSRTLIIGDAVTGIDWPFMHGHLAPAAYRQTLARLRGLVVSLPVERVLLAHYPVLDAAGLEALLQR